MPHSSRAGFLALTLRKYGARLLIGILSILFVLSFLTWQLPSSNRVLDHIQDFFHLPAFAALFFSLRWLVRDRQQWSPSIMIAVLAIGLGVAIEAVQAVIGRSSSWYDLLMDAGGIFAGYICWCVYERKLRSRWLLLVVFTALFGLLLPIYWAFAYWQRDQAFPVLLDFDSKLLTAFVDLQENAELTTESAPVEWHQNSTKAGRLEVKPSAWPGLFVYPAVSDWRAYNHLNLQVFSPNEDSISLSIRVDDIHYADGSGDNFDKHFTIEPGLNELRIPLTVIRRGPPDRLLNMEQVRLVFIYVSEPEKLLTLYLDDLQLD